MADEVAMAIAEGQSSENEEEAPAWVLSGNCHQSNPNLKILEAL